LVDIILTNNGYKVYNLGIKQPIENILHAAIEHHANAIGLSGLLVKSTVVMKEDLQTLKARGVTLPVICGGAALNRRYVEQDLRAAYGGPVYYGEDAFTGLHIMDDLCTKSAGMPLLVPLPVPDSYVSGKGKGRGKGTFVSNGFHSKVSRSVAIPKPPFLGSRVVASIDMREVFPFLNERTLISTQWQFRKNNVPVKEYERQMREVAYPALNRLKETCLKEGILRPAVVYGFFPCVSEGNDLVILHEDERSERLRFTFPRQESGDHLCLSDYFAEGKGQVTDYVSFMGVTMGAEVSRRAKEYFEKDRYTDYLYLHGLGVESAEALAEYWHKKIRAEWGFGHEDAANIQKLFKLHYRGCRYSFGYPACPELEDQVKLFELLNLERIGLALSEQFQLEPEQSTTALIAHHPEAKYFNVGSCVISD
ncbi:MAG TPA: vitamin B12 dependent-methionine synthase activation domain-containing protein, partial [Gemmataceae bacterium]|nr:vitamin B12 dependent-methionine synthase activation domain-containing protein [Gemmataceae bacterium]